MPGSNKVSDQLARAERAEFTTVSPTITTPLADVHVRYPMITSVTQ